LARLKANYQLGELVTVENYPEAIQLIAKFTVQSLEVSLLYFRIFKIQFLCVLFFLTTDVAIRSQQHPLFAITVAKNGLFCAICEIT
jgi:hypothetical protein